VRTYRINSEKRRRAFGFIRQYLDAGKQGYIVCPLNRNAGDRPGPGSGGGLRAGAAEDEFRNYRVGLLHGRLKPSQKEEIDAEVFRRGDTSF
jgi:ATP-dependent DNA helicase RecG